MNLNQNMTLFFTKFKGIMVLNIWDCSLDGTTKSFYH